MKIAFIPANVSGVSFYRVWQPAEALRKMGHKVAVLWYKHDHLHMHPWEEDLMTRETSIVRDVHMAYQWADCVVWQTIHTPGALQMFTELKNHYKVPTLTELDDYVFTLPEANIASRVYYPGSQESRIAFQQLSTSDALIVSTPYLKEAYGSFNKNIHVVENTINFSLWRKPPPRLRQSPNLTIGWVGGGTHNEDLALLLPVISGLRAQYPNIRWKFISGGPCPPEFKDIKNLQWKHAFKTIDKYPAFVAKQGFDIGVAPLVDNTFNRSKSNLRWLEYTALGIPTVASDVEHFRRSTAALASTTDEWIYELGCLIENHSERQQAKQIAEDAVKAGFTPKHAALKYQQILKEVITNARSNKIPAASKSS